MPPHVLPQPTFMQEVGRAFPVLVFVYASMAAAVGMGTSMLARRIVDKEPPPPAPGADLSSLLSEALVRTAVDASDAFLLFVLLIPVVAAILLFVCAVAIWTFRVCALILMPPRIADRI